MDSPKYKRILLKMSGEALAGDKKTGLDFDVINTFAASIKKCVDAGVEVGIVVGGGNYWRGRSSGAMDRTRAASRTGETKLLFTGTPPVQLFSSQPSQREDG